MSQPAPRVQSAYQKVAHFLGKDAAQLILPHAERHELNLNVLSQLQNEGRVKMVRSLKHRILTSYSSAIATLSRSISGDCPESLDLIKKLASSWNPFEECGENILVIGKPKSSGEGFRAVCKFGLLRRTGQTMVDDILSATFPVHPSDYLTKGRGAEKATDWVADQVGQGKTLFVYLDLKDFFRSVQHDDLAELLNLPPPVVSHYLLIGPDAHLSHKVCKGLTIEALDGAARSGLPQGSRSSQRAASIVLGPTLAQIVPTDQFVFYGDDILISASSTLEAKALIKVLTDRLYDHPNGQFRLKRIEEVDAQYGFDFTQYRIKRDFFTSTVRRSPSRSSYRRFEANVFQIAAQEPRFLRARFDAIKYRREWVKSFRRWSPVELSHCLLGLTFEEAFEKGRKLIG